MSKTPNRNPDQTQQSSRPSEMTQTASHVPAQRGWGSGWSPMRWRSEFDRLFNSLVPGWPPMQDLSEEMEFRWSMDVDDRDDKVIVRAEAPGFEKDDFDLQFRDNQLVLKAQHREETKQDGGRQWRQEELFRTISLPSGIDPDHVEAQYRNGISTVTIPITEQSKGHRIPIKD